MEKSKNILNLSKEYSSESNEVSNNKSHGKKSEKKDKKEECFQWWWRRRRRWINTYLIILVFLSLFNNINFLIFV